VEDEILAAGHYVERIELEMLDGAHRGFRPPLALPAAAGPQPLLTQDEAAGDDWLDFEQAC
jgi:hypothetical protein